MYVVPTLYALFVVVILLLLLLECTQNIGLNMFRTFKFNLSSSCVKCVCVCGFVCRESCVCSLDCFLVCFSFFFSVFLHIDCKILIHVGKRKYLYDREERCLNTHFT